jgi:hypothetical protein
MPAKKKTVMSDENISEDPIPSSKPTVSAKKKLATVKKDDQVMVKSCVYGQLTFISRSNGNSVVWNEFGDVAYMSVEDLIDMRNTQRAFFEKNWVIPVGDNAEAVIQSLQLEKYYETFSTFEDFDKIFSYNPEDIPAVMEKLSDSMKETVARRAYALIKDGTLDSVKMIDALEKELGYDLRENG